MNELPTALTFLLPSASIVYRKGIFIRSPDIIVL